MKHGKKQSNQYTAFRPPPIEAGETCRNFVVKRYKYIFVEDLKIKNMAKNKKLAKSIHDAGWSMFGNFLEYKAVQKGKVFLKVPPQGTSQECLCGASVPKDLSVRIHRCPICGLVEPRDLVSAKLIERRGLAMIA
ncbi:RNA-guided endonuclease InsQ/TnpB family protein [Desulforamulus putei]|uniref:RNA-guided endonuclease InsQ/TnpB family protein n=1 Tax=Desulforamulus putei TaxID=74701 RepID=UPI001EE45813|nr:transposase [Desulforamulus putei]